MHGSVLAHETGLATIDMSVKVDAWSYTTLGEFSHDFLPTLHSPPTTLIMNLGAHAHARYIHDDDA